MHSFEEIWDVPINNNTFQVLFLGLREDRWSFSGEMDTESDYDQLLKVKLKHQHENRTLKRNLQDLESVNIVLKLEIATERLEEKNHREVEMEKMMG